MNHSLETGATILVVDDEPGIVRLFLRALQSAGYANVHGLTEATDVPAFLDASWPDLVIMDINMPRMDGFALLREITSRLEEDAFLPVMAISGMVDMEVRERAFRSGAKDFMAKPVDIQEFLLHVNSLLETRFLSLRLQQTQERLADLVGVRTEELRRTAARAMEVEEALRLSEEQFRLLTETAGVAVGFFGLDGTILFLNRMAASYAGVNAEDLVGRPLTEMLDPAQAASMLATIEQVAARREILQTEDYTTLGSGKSRWFLSTLSSVVDFDGTVRGVQVVTSDVTEKKLADKELLESEERFNKAFHSSPVPSTMTGPDSRLIDVNDAWLRMLGLSRDQALGKTAVELGTITEEDRDRMIRSADECPGRPIEVPVRARSGEPLVLLVSTIFVDIKGERCLLATGIDITGRKRMEESLMLTQFCVDNAAESIIWFDVNGSIEYVNTHCSLLYGYSMEELYALSIFDIDPDVTRDGWDEQIRELRERGAMSISVHPAKRNGERFFGEVTMTLIDHGDRERVIAFLRDVTDRRRAEEALRTSEDRLQQMFASMSSGVAVYEARDNGADFVVKELNRSAERIVRSTQADCLGLSICEVFPGVRQLGLYDVIERVWRTGSPNPFPQVSTRTSAARYGWRTSSTDFVPGRSSASSTMSRPGSGLWPISRKLLRNFTMPSRISCRHLGR